MSQPNPTPEQSRPQRGDLHRFLRGHDEIVRVVAVIPERGRVCLRDHNDSTAAWVNDTTEFWVSLAVLAVDYVPVGDDMETPA